MVMIPVTWSGATVTLYNGKVFWYVQIVPRYPSLWPDITQSVVTVRASTFYNNVSDNVTTAVYKEVVNNNIL